MDTNLATQVIRSLTPYAFGPHDVTYVRHLLTRLTGDAFAALRNATVEVDTTEHENDTLNVGAYFIQPTIGESPSIVGPKFLPQFLPQFTVGVWERIPGSHDQPDDVVDLTVGDDMTLHGAISLIAGHELNEYMGSLAYTVVHPGSTRTFEPRSLPPAIDDGDPLPF